MSVLLFLDHQMLVFLLRPFGHRPAFWTGFPNSLTDQPALQLLILNITNTWQFSGSTCFADRAVDPSGLSNQP